MRNRFAAFAGTVRRIVMPTRTERERCIRVVMEMSFEYGLSSESTELLQRAATRIDMPNDFPKHNAGGQRAGDSRYAEPPCSPVDCRCGGEGQLFCLDDNIPGMEIAYSINCEDCDNEGPPMPTEADATAAWNAQENAKSERPSKSEELK